MDRRLKTEAEVIREYAQRIGANGGRKAAAKMTQEQRTARARKAAAARWAKTA